MPCTREHREEEGYALASVPAVHMFPRSRLLKTPSGYLVVSAVVAVDVMDASDNRPCYAEVHLTGERGHMSGIGTMRYNFGTMAERDEFVRTLIAAIEGP